MPIKRRSFVKRRSFFICPFFHITRLSVLLNIYSCFRLWMRLWQPYSKTFVLRNCNNSFYLISIAYSVICPFKYRCTCSCDYVCSHYAIKLLFGVIINIFILISLFNVTGGFLNSYLRYTYLLYMTVRIEFNCFNFTAFELGCRFLLNGKLFFRHIQI